jgi:hypothetical protein
MGDEENCLREIRLFNSRNNVTLRISEDILRKVTRKFNIQWIGQKKFK